jgi:hypothetical protein
MARIDNQNKHNQRAPPHSHDDKSWRNDFVIIGKSFGTHTHTRTRGRASRACVSVSRHLLSDLVVRVLFFRAGGFLVASDPIVPGSVNVD